MLVTLRCRRPNDTPRFSARCAAAVYPTSASSPAAAGSDRDEEEEATGETPETLRWTDRRARPLLVAGLLGGQAQAMMLGVIGFLILNRLPLRLRPDDAAALTCIVLMSGDRNSVVSGKRVSVSFNLGVCHLL